MRIRDRRITFAASLSLLVTAFGTTSSRAQVTTSYVYYLPAGPVVYMVLAPVPAQTFSVPAASTTPASAPAWNDAAPPAPIVPSGQPSFRTLATLNKPGAANLGNGREFALPSNVQPATDTASRGSILRFASLVQRPGGEVGNPIPKPPTLPATGTPPDTTPEPTPKLPTPEVNPSVIPAVILLKGDPKFEEMLKTVKSEIQDADFSVFQSGKKDVASRKTAILNIYKGRYAHIIAAPNFNFDEADQVQKDELGQIVDEMIASDGSNPLESPLINRNSGVPGGPGNGPPPTPNTSTPTPTTTQGGQTIHILVPTGVPPHP